MSDYKHKYLKYKEKYTSLKKQFGGNKNKVLIVVDLQNCFLEHFGTLGWQPKDNTQTRDVIIGEYKKRMFELLSPDNIKNYDVVVFTKDSHPLGHASFNTEKGIYNPHCIDTKKMCTRKGLPIPKPTSVNRPTLEEQSQLTAQYRDVVEKGKNIITINDSDYEESIKYNIKLHIDEHELQPESGKVIPNTKKHIKYHMPPSTDGMLNELRTVPSNRPLIVRLNKGELCDNDAYSGFLYHTYYQPGIQFETDILEQDYKSYSDHTTGLYELLRTFYGSNFINDITIDVCGLVTNICVVNTCIGGLKIFREEINNTRVKFRLLNKYSLNLHLDVVPSAIKKLQKCKLQDKTDYEVVENEAAATGTNKIYIVNEPAADRYTCV